MINYKSFDLGAGAKLRVRADHIIATKSSNGSNQIELYVAGIAYPVHIPIEGAPSKVIDYVWEREHIEKEDN